MLEVNMNWEIVGAISEIVGAIAVVVSLIYVAVQIKQNTRLMRATAKQSLTEATQNVVFKLADNSDAYVKLVSGEEPSSPEEDARMSLLARAAFRGFESQCFQYESGLLEEDEWLALRAAIVDFATLPGFNRYWQGMRLHMSKRLRSIIEEG